MKQTERIASLWIPLGNVKWKMERNGTYPNSSKYSPVCIGDFAILDEKNKSKIASFGFSTKVKMINERSALFLILESNTHQKFTLKEFLMLSSFLLKGKGMKIQF